MKIWTFLLAWIVCLVSLQAAPAPLVEKRGLAESVKSTCMNVLETCLVKSMGYELDVNTPQGAALEYQQMEQEKKTDSVKTVDIPAKESVSLKTQCIRLMDACIIKAMAGKDYLTESSLHYA